MKEIPLTQGKVAIVDDDDYEWINQWKWQAHKEHNVFYAVRHESRTLGHKVVRMHRLISGWGDNWITDHINGNGLDNRRENLRRCSNSENLQNRGAQSNNTSGYKGVHFDARRNKWYAQVCKDKQTYSSKNYETAEEAAREYDKLAKIHHGSFAHLNFEG